MAIELVALIKMCGRAPRCYKARLRMAIITMHGYRIFPALKVNRNWGLGKLLLITDPHAFSQLGFQFKWRRFPTFALPDAVWPTSPSLHVASFYEATFVLRAQESE